MTDSWLNEDLDAPIAIASASVAAAGTSASSSRAGQSRRSDNSRATRPGRTPNEDRADTEPPDDLIVEEKDETPLAQLMRSWLNERHSPDLLAGEEAIVGRLLDHVRKQVRSLIK